MPSPSQCRAIGSASGSLCSYPKVLRYRVYDHAHREHGVDMSIAAQLKVHEIGLSGGFRCKPDNILMALGRPTVQARVYPNVLSGGLRCKPVNTLLAPVVAYGASP